MYKQCKSEQSAERQRSLELALLGAMLTARYDSINISDLCQQMKIPRKAFYRYFSGKEGALQALIDHTLLEYEAFTGAFGGESPTLTEEMEHFFLFWQAQKQLLDALSASDLGSVLVRRAVVHGLSDPALTALVQEEPPAYRNRVLSFAIGGLMNTVLDWHRGGYRESVEAMALTAVRLMTQPLFSDLRRKI